jgi:hypothetical protein
MTGEFEPEDSEVRRISLENLRVKREAFENKFTKQYVKNKVYIDPSTLYFQNEHEIYLSEDEEASELPFKFIEEKKLEIMFNETNQDLIE